MADSKSPSFDPYHRWLGIPITHRPPTHYQLLGIMPDEKDIDVIEEAAIRQSTYLRAYQVGPHAADCTRILGEIAQARNVLLNPQKRKEYDARLDANTNASTPSLAPQKRPEFSFDAGEAISTKPLKKAARPEHTNDSDNRHEKRPRRKPAKSTFPIIPIAAGGAVALVLVLGLVAAVLSSRPAPPPIMNVAADGKKIDPLTVRPKPNATPVVPPKPLNPTPVGPELTKQATGLERSARVTMSFAGVFSRTEKINDGEEPKTSKRPDGQDTFNWWPHKGTQEWVQYTWEKPVTAVGVRVYWVDDTGNGETRLPVSWEVRYKDGEQWKLVQDMGGYPIAKDSWCDVRFLPVTTTELRLAVQMEKGFAAGIHELRVTAE